MFTGFFYQTRKTWSRSRRVVAKAEQIPGKENPRYVVTSLPLAAWPTRELYEQLYCAVPCQNSSRLSFSLCNAL